MGHRLLWAFNHLPPGAFPFPRPLCKNCFGLVDSFRVDLPPPFCPILPLAHRHNTTASRLAPGLPPFPLAWAYNVIGGPDSCVQLARRTCDRSRLLESCKGSFSSMFCPHFVADPDPYLVVSHFLLLLTLTVRALTQSFFVSEGFLFDAC